MKETKITAADIASSIIEESVPVSVTIRQKSKWHGLLQRYGMRPKSVVFHIQPLCLGSLIRISGLILEIDKDILAGDNIMDKSYMAIQKHADTVIKVVAIAITNCEEEPAKDLMDLIRREFTSKDLANMLTLVVEKMNITNFLISIISVKGLNVIKKAEMSPTDQGSPIASGV